MHRFHSPFRLCLLRVQARAAVAMLEEVITLEKGAFVKDDEPMSGEERVEFWLFGCW